MILYNIDKDLKICRFIKRINRFIAEVKCERNDPEYAHLNNTGKLKDLLIPNTPVVCMNINGKKTNIRIIGTIVDDRWATLIDTRIQENSFIYAVNHGYIPWLENFKIMARDIIVNRSRIDLMAKDKYNNIVYIELKSAVYFFKDDLSARYPDTISLRGRRHIMELINMKYLRRIIVFIAGHPYARVFKPSYNDPEIPLLLKSAQANGVEIRSVKIALKYWEKSIILLDPDLPVDLNI